MCFFFNHNNYDTVIPANVMLIFFNLFFLRQTEMLKKAVEVIITGRVNPLSHHDALMHHFTSLNKDLIFLQLDENTRF